MERAKKNSHDDQNGRSAIVTGSASGIGRAVAHDLVVRGVAVCLVDIAPMSHVVDELAALGGTVVAVQGDTTDRATMVDAVRVARSMGSLGSAVLNAGVLAGESNLSKLDDERYERVVGANITGVVHGLREFIEGVQTNPGRVVVTSSSVGLVPAPHDPIYSMTKHAVIGLVRSLALNPAYDRVRINCICPNGVDTPMLGEAFKAGRNLLSPSDVAARIIEILEDDQSGRAWVCTPDQFKPFEFAPNPGYSFPTFAESR